MSSALLATTTFLVNACWQVALLGFAFALLDRLCRFSPETRYRLLLCAVALQLLVPLWSTTRSRQAPESAPTHRVQLEDGRADAGLHVSGTDISASPTPLGGRDALSLVATRRVLISVFVLYGAFLAQRLLQFSRRVVATRRLSRDDYPIETPQVIVDALRLCQQRLGQREPRLRWSSRLAGPVSVGIRRPTIVLPYHLLQQRCAAFWRAVLAHEMAHIRRGDFVTNLVVELVSLPVSFHPASAWIKTRLDQAREQSCDALAVKGLDDLAAPRELARALLTVADHAIQKPTQKMSMAAVGSAPIEERIMRLVGPPEHASAMTRSLCVGVASLLTLATSATFVTVGAYSARQIAPGEALQSENPSSETQARDRTVPYQSRARRDPFLNPTATVSHSPAGGVPGFEAQTCRLQGIVTTGSGRTAMIEGPDQKTYFIRVGQIFYDGVVSAITEDRIIVSRQRYATLDIGPIELLLHEASSP